MPDPSGLLGSDSGRLIPWIARALVLLVASYGLVWLGAILLCRIAILDRRDALRAVHLSWLLTLTAHLLYWGWMLTQVLPLQPQSGLTYVHVLPIALPIALDLLLVAQLTQRLLEDRRRLQATGGPR